MRPYGAASRWWLAQSLRALDRALQERGNRLLLRRGPAREIVPRFAAEAAAGTVLWNRRYDAPGIRADAEIERTLATTDIAVRSFPGNLLGEPGAFGESPTVSVFTPFWRRLRAGIDAAPPSPAPGRIPLPSAPAPACDRLDDWQS